MQAKSTDRKTFQLTDDAQLLGELVYESMFLQKAEIKLANAELYPIRQLGVFGTVITVKKNEDEIANLKMNWRGQIVFTFHDGQEFVLKGKGIFYNKYIIEDKDGKNLVQFEPTFNWSKFNYNYVITYEEKPQDILLVLLGVYAANYLIASMSGVVAGMG